MSNYIMDLRKLVGHRPLLQVGASVIVEDAEGRILLQLRSDNRCWGYAGGSVELDEVVEDAAKRELLEETGLTAHRLEFFGVFSGPDTHYVYPNGREPEEEILKRTIRELGFSYDEEEDEDGAANGKVKKRKKAYTVQRYKGRGEMDPKQLASTTMDPRTRILQRVSIDDAAAADRAVRELMGSQVEYRRDYIERHAHDARFLDA